MDPQNDATQSGSEAGPVQANAPHRASGQFGTSVVDLTGYIASGEPLGKGGGVSVFLFARPDAEKFALKKCERSEEALMEVHVLSAVRNENILKLITVLRPYPDEYQLVLELMSGSLKEVFTMMTLPVGQIAVVLQHILAGVAALHRSRIIQCDVKALNVLYDGKGRVVIADFGLSTTYDGQVP